MAMEDSPQSMDASNGSTSKSSGSVKIQLSKDETISEYSCESGIASSSVGFQRGISPMSTNSAGRRVSQAVATDFIRAETANDDFRPAHVRSTHDIAWFATYSLKTMFRSRHFDHFMACIVVIDAFCNCYDIDARAAGVSAPAALMIVSYLCLVLYTIEFSLSICFLGRSAIHNNMIKLDAFLIICGYIELLFDLAMLGTAFSKVSILRILRLMRVFRLLKIFRKVKALRELNKLVKMMSTCMKALLWSFCFCFMVMTVWAMLVVEVVHPLVKNMDEDLSMNCDDDCLRSTSSVMDANLLLFKTVIAGDSWGQLAVPVIRAHPYTALLFVGAYLTIVFGVLNLIVAVVVDTFADARERDVLNLAEEMEHDLKNDQKYLQKIFENIDFDSSGELTFEQLLQGARKNAEFQSRLRVMDIDEGDLKELFHMIDIDGSGTIEPHEFIRPLSRWVHDSKTAPRFIKYNMMRCVHQQEELQRVMEITFHSLASKIEEVSRDLKSVLHTPTSSSFCTSTWRQQGLSPKSSPITTCISRENGEEVEQPKRSLPVTLKEVLPNSIREAATSEAMQHLREVLTVATDLALENSIATIERLFRQQPLDVTMHDHAIKLPNAQPVEASRLEFEAVENIPPSRPVPNIAAGNGSVRLHLPGIRERSESLEEPVDRPGVCNKELPSLDIRGFSQ